MITKLKITVLSENIAHIAGLAAEHGLSLLIEANSKKILFDTGASDIFLKNAALLNDISSVKDIVLSHGHYDHTGGLKYLKDKTVHCHTDVFIPKYKSTNTIDYAYIGNDYIRCFYEHNNNLHFEFCTTSRELFPGFWLITDFNKDIQERYFYKSMRLPEYVPDDFSDELALAIQTNVGLVIITGCAHSGITNIIDKCLSVTGEKKIHMLLGGFHTSKKTSKELMAVAIGLNAYAIENIGISHCTGDILEKYLAGAVLGFHVGDMVNI